jgi:hypothetical protein
MNSRDGVLDVDFQYVAVQVRGLAGRFMFCTSEGAIESLVMLVPKQYARSVSFNALPIRREVLDHEAAQPCPVLRAILPDRSG